jgi:hypothetical protein
MTYDINFPDKAFKKLGIPVLKKGHRKNIHDE